MKPLLTLLLLTLSIFANILSSTYDAVGNRTKVVENTGRTVARQRGQVIMII